MALNWYPKIQAQQSKGVTKTDDSAVKHEGKLEERHLAFMDIDAIWFELQHFKNERSWYNLNLDRDCILQLLSPPNNQWYKLFIPPEELEFTQFDRVRRWEEIAVALLKKYVDRYYKHKKQEWESDFYEYHELREDDPNFVSEYRLLIDESQDAIVEKLGELKEKIENGTLADWTFGNLHAISFGQHLYQPLLHFKSDFVDVSPVSLNEGEKEFVTDLRTFYDDNPVVLRGPGTVPAPQHEPRPRHRLLRGRELLPRLPALAADRRQAVRHVRRSEGHPKPRRP